MKHAALTSSTILAGRRTAGDPNAAAAGRIRLSPTRFGKTFLLILAAMLVGSLNSNNNLGFLLTFLLGSMAAVSLGHTRRNLSGIQLASLRAKPVFAGEKAHFEVVLQKAGPAARAVEVVLSGESPVLLDRIGGSPTAATIGIPAGQRGLLAPGLLKIRTGYPFGLFQARLALLHTAVCLVYPRPMNGSLPAMPGAPLPGAGSGLAAGAGVEDFAGLRPYQPGDNLGQISWKSFSRGQGLQVKQFSGESGRALTIDWHALAEPDLERKLSRLCGMVLYAHRTGLHFGLRLPTVELPPARGESHLQACLSHLAMFGLPGSANGVLDTGHGPDSGKAT